jgi:hypothetical protein
VWHATGILITFLVRASRRDDTPKLNASPRSLTAWQFNPQFLVAGVANGPHEVGGWGVGSRPPAACR